MSTKKAKRPKVKVQRLDMYVYTGNPLLDAKYDQELKDYQTEVPVVFNRDGIYKTKDACWFETNGKAYEHDASMFDYTLSLINADERGIEVYRALSGLAKAHPKKLSKEDREFLALFQQSRDLKIVSRRMKHRLKGALSRARAAVAAKLNKDEET